MVSFGMYLYRIRNPGSGQIDAFAGCRRHRIHLMLLVKAGAKSVYCDLSIHLILGQNVSLGLVIAPLTRLRPFFLPVLQSVSCPVGCHGNPGWNERHQSQRINANGSPNTQYVAHLER